MLIEMQLRQIVINEMCCQGQLVVLREKDGDTELYVCIGPYETLALNRVVKGMQPSRPLTHQLLNNVIHELGAEVLRLEIRELCEGTFIGTLIVMNQEGKEVEINCRPSDGFVLCVLNGAQIFAEETVLEQAGTALQQ